MYTVSPSNPGLARERIKLYNAAKDRINEICLLGVASACDDLDEPENEHIPGLINMEEYEDWTSDSTTFAEDKRIEKGQLVFCGSEMDVEDMFSSVSTRDGGQKNCRHALIIASAGMGKTTLLKKIAHDGLSGKYKMLEGKIVLMPELRSFSADLKISPGHVLLDGLFPDNEAEQINQSYKWMLENAKDIVFVIDSLDTLPFDFEQERLRIRPYDKDTLDVIIHNLLAGDLFPESRIISSSREHKVRNLHPSVRPDRCILLDGLKRDSVDDLIDGFVGEQNGAEMKKHINTECPDVWPLLSIPMLLVCSVISFLRGGFKPRTMSGILLKYLVGLVDSANSRSENISEVFPKLMSLSFHGIQKGHVLFQPLELTRFGLEPHEITGLGAAVVPARQKPYLLSKLMQSDRYFLYFNHQTMQECLSALDILGIKTDAFTQCIKSLDKPGFSIVRRFICGILLNPEVLLIASRLIQISDFEEKKKILLKYLKSAIRREQRSFKKDGLLELIVDLNEAKDGATSLICSALNKVNLSFIQLSESNVQAVASALSRCERLKEIRLNNCNINSTKMEILTNTIMESKLKVNSLHLGVNDLGKTGMMLLSKLAKHCEVETLGIYGCGLESERVKAFLVEAVGLKLKKLFASNNATIESEGMFFLGKLVRVCTPEEFGVRNCKLTPECVKSFAEGASNTKITKLDVSVNKELGIEGVSILGTLVKNGLVKDIMAAGCNFKPDHLQSLITSLGSTKVRSLDINDYSNKPLYSRHVLDLVSCVESELDLRHWKIDENQRREILERQKQLGSKLRILLLNDMKRDEKPFDVVMKGKEIVAFDGGDIELDGCIVKIPAGGLVKNANIEFFLESWGVSNQPKKTVAISPVIVCDFSHVGLNPGYEVEVEMRSYCFAQQPVTASLMGRDANSGEWVEEKKVIFSRDRILKFKTSSISFRKYFAFKRGTGNGWVVTFPVAPILRFDKYGNFRLFLALDDPSVARKLNSTPGVDVFESTVEELDPLVIKFGDSVATELQCIHPSTASFEGDNRCQFTADELIQNIYLQRDFSLISVQMTQIQGGILKLSFSWEKNRPFPERSTAECHIRWPPTSDYPVGRGPVDSISRDASTAIRLGQVSAKTSKSHFEESVTKEDEGLLARYDAMMEKIYNTVARKTETISPEGGQIELHGIRISFPHGAVNHPTDVEIFTDNNPDHYPDFVTPICLMYGCKPSRFKVPVEVTVSTWFRLKGNRTVSAKLYVLSKSSGQKWVETKALDLTRTGEIRYSAPHFCKHNIGISYDNNGDGYYEFYNDVWINNHSARIVPFFCKKDKKVLEGVRKDLEPDHTRIISLTEEPEIYLGSTVSMDIDWEDPDTLGMKIIGKNPFSITEKELRRDKIHCYFKPTPDLTRLNRNGPNELTYKTEVHKSDGALDEDASIVTPLSFNWPAVRADEQRRDGVRNIVQIYHQVNAENFITSKPN